MKELRQGELLWLAHCPSTGIWRNGAFLMPSQVFWSQNQNQDKMYAILPTQWEIFWWPATLRYDKPCFRQKNKKSEGKWRVYEVTQNMNNKQKVPVDLQIN